MTHTSPMVTLASGPTGPGSIDDFELFYARRSLELLKARLGHDGLRDLLAADIEAGNAFLRDAVVASHGKLVSGTVVLTTDETTADEFLAWFEGALADETILLAAHPEHWGFSMPAGGPATVVETIGSHPSAFTMAGWGAALPAWVAESDALLPDAEYPVKIAADLVLEDRTVIGRVFCQFGDTPTGFSAALTVSVPESCAEIVEQHLRHFAVEFRNWIVASIDAGDRAITSSVAGHE